MSANGLIMDGASLLLVGGEKEGARAQIVSAANVGVKPVTRWEPPARR